MVFERYNIIISQYHNIITLIVVLCAFHSVVMGVVCLLAVCMCVLTMRFCDRPWLSDVLLLCAFVFFWYSYVFIWHSYASLSLFYVVLWMS